MSVVVPVYNESDIVPEMIHRLSEIEAGEIIVVDGGSTDETWPLIKQLQMKTMSCHRGNRGRAAQMNNGALRAAGDILLFLHADTQLPPGALELIEEALHRQPKRCWGRFDVRFDNAGPILRTVAWAMNLRSAWTSICTGDQAMFVRRDEFLRIGGFAPILLMEDVDLSGRLKRLSRPVRVRTPVTTSSRRWITYGVWRTIGLMWWLRWMYWWGVPTFTLAERYHRKT